MRGWRYRLDNDDYEIARWEKMELHAIHGSRSVDWAALRAIGAEERFEEWIPDDSPWERMLADLQQDAHRPLTIEFISTFRYAAHPAGVDPPVGPDGEPEPEVQFRLFGQLYSYTMDQWATTCCWYREEELVQDMYTTAITTLPDDMLMAWWPTIGGEAYGEDGERYYFLLLLLFSSFSSCSFSSLLLYLFSSLSYLIIIVN
jgi:hypothetical protein